MPSDKAPPVRTRVVTNMRIVHNDLELGHGSVDQQRGVVVKTEKRIELNWIFRSVDEIQHLDTVRYTRVSLHQDGQLREYWYDKTSEAVPNLKTVLKPYIVTRAGRWLLINYVDHKARAMITKLQAQLDALNT